MRWRTPFIYQLPDERAFRRRLAWDAAIIEAVDKANLRPLRDYMRRNALDEEQSSAAADFLPVPQERAGHPPNPHYSAR
jgi:hypothetical protein